MNIPFHKTQLFAPNQLKFKLSDMVQKMFLRASTVLHNMGNQAEIPLDENIAGFQVALGAQG